MTQPNIPRKVRQYAMWCHTIVLIGQPLLIPAFFLILGIPEPMPEPRTYSMTYSARSQEISMAWGFNLLLLLPLVDFCWSIGLVFLFWQFNRHRHRFVEASGKEMMNFLLSLILYLVVFDSITIGSCGFSVYNRLNDLSVLSALLYTIVAMLNIFWLFLVISMANVGGSRAAKGEIHHYPMTIRFLN
jgi:uncharacterized Tic20 family protein